jgi:hypothetical protein
LVGPITNDVSARLSVLVLAAPSPPGLHAGVTIKEVDVGANKVVVETTLPEETVTAQIKKAGKVAPPAPCWDPL